ncbi:MAG: hypothetical protein WBG73_01045 [Coleofasciculaceae cyanobacterium]
MKTLSSFQQNFKLLSGKSITVGLLVLSQLGIILPPIAKGREISSETYQPLSLINTKDRVFSLKQYSTSTKPSSIGATVLNSALVSLAINEYLLTTSGGPVGNRNYWKNAGIPVSLMYIDFNNYFALRFNTDVIPTPSNRGAIYTTTLPDGTVVVARPFSNSRPYLAPTLEIQRPTGAPYKVRYLPPKQCLAFSENLLKRVSDCY